jgi:2,4-dienoyl-CoA reductase-like NADH-dependent reductase (Old Yellow Enzyme family)
MGSPDFREQFLYAATVLNGFSLGYLHLLDGLAFGFHELGEPLTLADFRQVYSGKLMGNCGYTKESAEAAISGGTADLISFGRPYITNPDLPERFANGWPLADDAPQTLWYNFDERGYVEYPRYEAAG